MILFPGAVFRGVIGPMPTHLTWHLAPQPSLFKANPILMSSLRIRMSYMRPKRARIVLYYHLKALGACLSLDLLLAFLVRFFYCTLFGVNFVPLLINIFYNGSYAVGMILIMRDIRKALILRLE